eukprot:750060-Hanusia_phi.AAC.1
MTQYPITIPLPVSLRYNFVPSITYFLFQRSRWVSPDHPLPPAPPASKSHPFCFNPHIPP